MKLVAIVRVITGLVGLLLVYLAVFTYETTDRRIANRLETLWLELSYDTRTPAGLARQIAQFVLNAIDRLLDRLLGPRFVSMHSVAVAACFAYAASAMSFIPFSLLVAVADLDIDIYANTPGRTAVYAVVIVILVIGVLPAIRYSLRWITYATAVWMIVSVLLAAWFIQTGRGEILGRLGNAGTILASTLVSLAYGVAVIHATRYVLRTSKRPETQRWQRLLIAAILALPAVIFAAMMALTYAASHPNSRWVRFVPHGSMALGLLFDWVGPISSIWGLAIVVGLILTLVLLLHLALWPIVRFVLMKLLYAAQRHQLMRRMGAVGSLGAAMLLWASGLKALWSSIFG